MLYHRCVLAEQRYEIIEKCVSQLGSVTVDRLLAEIPVSKMTIWRDLRYLDKLGRVKKVHGGASRIASSTDEEPGFYSKSVINQEAKDAIAAFASQRFVSDNDVILLEGGTTAMHMIQYLHQTNLTVLTNGLNTLNAAATDSSDLSIMVCGGLLRKPSLTFVGPEAERFFHDFSADTLFLSGTGLSRERGLTDPNPLEIQVKRAMMRCARRTVILVDASKIGVESLKTVCSPGEINAIVTDENGLNPTLQAFRESGIEVLSVSP
jgi:DeoR family fructose operon transcriptional repressor